MASPPTPRRTTIIFSSRCGSSNSTARAGTRSATSFQSDTCSELGESELCFSSEFLGLHKTARALSLTVPSALLARADEGPADQADVAYCAGFRTPACRDHGRARATGV